MWQDVVAWTDKLMLDVPFKLTASLFGSVVASMLGGISALVVILFLLLCCDFLLGFCRAWVLDRISGRKMRAGVGKMFFYAVAVFVMAAVEHAVRQSAATQLVRQSGVPFPVRDFFIAFLCINEALSCMEHLAFFGVPFPRKLRGRLRKYRDAIFNEENRA